MMTIYIVLLLVVVVSLVAVTAIRPIQSELGLYELERLATRGDKKAKELLRRERLLPDILSLQRLMSSLLLVVFVALSVATLGWLFGILAALVVALEYGYVARIPLVSRPVNIYYVKYEQYVLRFVEKCSGVLRFMRYAAPEQPPVQLHSREELTHLVKESVGILSAHEKSLIVNGLAAQTRPVEDIMTPRSMVDSIDQKEHLGPLVLDDLHKTGHSRFPVIDGDIDHIVGMLHIKDLLEIDTKRKSTSVTKAMDPRVYYIKQDQTLGHALAAFLKTRHHLFVVINEFRETVGLVSLEDVLESILGRKIVDEFDTHEDLRRVAGRNPRRNNHPVSATDV